MLIFAVDDEQLLLETLQRKIQEAAPGTEVEGFNRGQLHGLEAEVDQLWAEAVVRWRGGEALWLDDAEVYAMAEQEQMEHTVVDDWTDEIQTYLDTLLPIEWEDMDRLQRRAYFDWKGGTYDLGGKVEGTEPRQRVSGKEIQWELFGNELGKGNNTDGRRIANIMNFMPGWKRIKGTYRDKCYGVVRGWEREM